MSAKHMVGYVRVSTDEQERSGLGAEAQREAIRQRAERNGWTYEVFEDLGCSGKHVNPQLRRALDLLGSGQFDGLVVAKLDRLARSAQHALAIINTAREQGWNFVVLDVDLDLSTAQGRLFAQLLSSFAEFERELISTRTKEALAARVRRGERNGRPSAIPAGLLRRIVLARDEGESFASIARALTEERHLTPTGLATWHESTVRRAYAGAQRTDAS
jgi:DNA invertase Pin-like site-specific DNA recombinase